MGRLPIKPLRPQVLVVVGCITLITVIGLLFDNDIQDLMLIVSALVNVALAIITLDRDPDKEDE